MDRLPETCYGAGIVVTALSVFFFSFIFVFSFNDSAWKCLSCWSFNGSSDPRNVSAHNAGLGNGMASVHIYLHFFFWNSSQPKVTLIGTQLITFKVRNIESLSLTITNLSFLRYWMQLLSVLGICGVEVVSRGKNLCNSANKKDEKYSWEHPHEIFCSIHVISVSIVWRNCL